MPRRPSTTAGKKKPRAPKKARRATKTQSRPPRNRVKYTPVQNAAPGGSGIEFAASIQPREPFTRGWTMGVVAPNVLQQQDPLTRSASVIGDSRAATSATSSPTATSSAKATSSRSSTSRPSASATSMQKHDQFKHAASSMAQSGRGMPRAVPVPPRPSMQASNPITHDK